MISLENKTILVTREEKAAQVFADKIITYGGKPVITPLLQINCLAFHQQEIASIDMNDYDWVFFTSKNGVDCFMKQSKYATNLHHCQIAAVGPKTAQAVKEYGFHVDFIPSTYNAEVMAAEFLTTYEEAGPVLFVRGKIASNVLLDAFTKAERAYHCVEVYDTVTNEAVKSALQTSLMEETIDFITFTSPSTVNAFIQLTDQVHTYKHLPVVCIGTTTERQAKEQGFLQTIVPENFTIEGMIEAMDHAIKREG